MAYTILGPSLVDFADRLQRGIAETSQLLTTRGCGTLVGSALVGIVFDAYDQYLTLALSMALSLATLVALPFMLSFAAALSLGFAMGAGLGFLDAGKEHHVWG